MSRREDIDNAIWTDPDFEALSPHATLLYLWSFTNLRCGMAGLYKVSCRAMTESKVPEGMLLDEVLAELSEANFLFYEDQVLLVRTRVRHLRSRSPQMAKSVANDVEKVPVDHPLRRRFLDEYGDHSWLREALRERVKETYREGLGTLSENPVDTGDSDTLSIPSPEGPGQGQGLSSSSPTTVQAGELDRARASLKRRTVDQNELPPSLPDELRPVAIKVLPLLESMHEQRGGNIPTLRGVGLVLDRYPDRDHLRVVRELEHWAIAGNGQRKPVADWPKTLGTFLERSTPAAPTRNGSGVARQAVSPVLNHANRWQEGGD